MAHILAAKEVEAEHVHDVGLGDAHDRAIWDHASKSGAVIVTKDEDVASLITLHPDGPPIVWVRIGNTSKQALLRWFGPLMPEIVAAIRSGEKLIEVV